MKVFYEADADLSVLTGKTIGMVGYGNQGRAQALNLRDSGVKVVVGNRDDEYAKTALADGFTPVPIPQAVRSGDIVMVLIPDEVQPSVYESMIAPHLREGQTLSFASGYNVHFKLIEPRPDLDVIMVAPRTIGREVRHAFERGGGVNADVDVRQDFTGSAWATTLALAKGIGCTRAGAFHTSFGVEAELDLFSEQGLWPALFECLLTAYDILIEKGYPPEAVALELYASGEAADIFRAMAEKGIFEQMTFHSPTSQYGVLSRQPGATGDHELLAARMRQTLEYIRSGQFAREWTHEQQADYPKFSLLRSAAANHAINRADRDIRQLLDAGKPACAQTSS